MGGKGKPICLVSFILFKCYCNDKMESNNLCREKYPANFPLKKKRQQPPSLSLKDAIQISDSVCIIEI